MVVGIKKFTMEYVVPKIAKNLKKRFDTKQDIFKSIDEKAGSNVSNQKKSEIKLDASKKVSKIYDKYENKAKGGRVGLKGGTFPDLSGDGKTTMKDILMGRGVIPKPKNKKKMMAKKSETPMDKAIKKKNKKII